jgi:RHS repeat-associated protein
VIDNELLFQGRRYEKETNLIYFRARYYDPIMGRFLSVDPMGYQDSMNLYQGFNMNPVNFVDPFGKWNLNVHKAITREALKKISSNWDYWQWKEFRKALVRGSILPDIPEGKIGVGKAWIVYKFGGKTWTRSFRTHYGDLAAWHAMRYGNQTREEVIRAMKFFIMIRAVTAKTMLLQGLRDRSLPNWKRRELIRQAGLMLGRSLHIIEDSYARGHTERNENMEIVQFFDYNEQQKSPIAKKMHEAGDKIKDNEEYFNEAAASVARVLELFDRSNSVDEFEAELEKFLDLIFILQKQKKRPYIEVLDRNQKIILK